MNNYQVFVIRDENSGLYFTGISENTTIFLDDIIEEIMTFNTKADALEYLAWILDVRHPRFVNDNLTPLSETPKWVVGKLKVSFEFEEAK